MFLFNVIPEEIKLFKKGLAKKLNWHTFSVCYIIQAFYPLSARSSQKLNDSFVEI